jgi:hypothetical protein
MTDPVSFENSTPRLALPLLFAGQAQKEFTVNEALLVADLAVQCSVEGEVAAPPAGAVPGQAWLVAASPSGAFAGHPAAIAGLTSAGWRFIDPKAGFRVYDKAAGCFRHYTGSWRLCVVPATPTGGVTIDQPARDAIASILERLIDAGILAAS